eukprot:gene5076-3662_t
MQRYLMNSSYLQENLKQLYKLHTKTVSDYGELVKNLNDECTILCDLIPNYKIAKTLETEDGNSQRKQKEVFNIQKLEHEVLTQYEHFLQLLRKLYHKSHPEQQALGSRLCARLVGSSAPEFNNSDVLLGLAVDFANCRSSRVARPCLDALSTLLDGQMVSEATEYIVSALLNIVRKKSYAINPKLLNILLHVRVAMVDVHRQDITEEKAKNKKLKREEKELARQMQKAKARRDRAELAVKQTRIIHRVFVIYLRVIEASKSCTPEHQTKILAPTLEGLVKFAPLVNLELYHQLMEALKDLVNDESSSVTTKLHALIAVASLAQRDATATVSEWRVDLSYFHEVLFQCLLEALEIPSADPAQKMTRDPTDEEAGDGEEDEVASRGSTSSAGSLSSQAFSIANSMAQGHFVQANASKEWTFHVSLVLRAVDLLFLTQKHIPISRVTAVLRRLLQQVPLCPPHTGMALLALCHRLVLRYPLAGGIIIGGSDNAISGRGAYNPAALQTSSANADSSFVWELSILTRSYHPTLQQVAAAFCRHFFKLSKHRHGEPVVVSKQLNALGPYEVMEAYDPSDGDFKPAMQPPKEKKATSEGASQSYGKRERAEESDSQNGRKKQQQQQQQQQKKNQRHSTINVFLFLIFFLCALFRPYYDYLVFLASLRETFIFCNPPLIHLIQNHSLC